MFANCTNLISASELPATNLAEECYCAMFSGCTSLQKIEVSFKDWGNSEDWLNNTAKQGTFICPKELELKYGEDYIPEGWKVEYKD